MADIFISYDRSCEAHAVQVADALKAIGYGVWRDDELPAHRSYSEVIEERLHAAKAVVVLWSKEAVRSQWVRAEADVARREGKLVQVAIEPVVPPLPFNQIHCVNLQNWSGAAGGAGWRKVVASVAELVSAPAPGAEAPPGSGSPPPAPASVAVAKRAAPRLSIVVLPFANISGDPLQEYFVDGVTESLTTDLSRIRGSFVIARNTAFTFKGKAADAQEVGRALNVRYVLEGSVQRGADRMRVNVQLIDVETGAHLWAERFDKALADIFQMQDEIVTRLARALDVQLVAAEARRAERSVDPDSMDLYFQGQAAVNFRFGPEEFIRARALWTRALELDPRNVDALAALAQYDALAVALSFTADGGDASYEAAETYARRALDLAADHANAHLALAQVYLFTNRLNEAQAEFQRAHTLDRNLAHAYAGFATTKLYGGHAEEAEAQIVKAFNLSPHDARAHLWCLIAGTANLFAGEYAAADVWFRRGVEINQVYPVQLLYVAAAQVGEGQLDEARATVLEALEAAPNLSIRLIRSGRRSTNPIYLKQLGGLLDKMRQAGVPEG